LWFERYELNKIQIFAAVFRKTEKGGTFLTQATLARAADSGAREAD
jgi:hypothetical protein